MKNVTKNISCSFIYFLHYRFQLQMLVSLTVTGNAKASYVIISSDGSAISNSRVTQVLGVDK